jgi:FkbM family methyltransferase
MFSASDEEKVIGEYFGDHRGRFLDIGAYDGVVASNTRALLDREWSGVSVEPNPEVFLRLREEMAGYPVKCVNTALGPWNSVAKFYFWPGPGNASSGGSCKEEFRDVTRRIRKLDEPAEMYTAMTAVETLLEQFPGPYDFVNLDTEGLDWEILQDLPVKGLGVRLLCVEYGQDHAAFEAWARANHYAILWENDCNMILAVEE